MTDLDTFRQHEPEPTIVIACRRVPVLGQPVGAFTLEPRISISNMPGQAAEAWQNTHRLLCQAMQIVLQEVVKATQGQSRLMVVPGMPGELTRQ